MSATVAQLRAAGMLLLQTHGQQDSWLLSQEETHLGFIDQFGGLEAQREQYTAAFERMRALKSRLSSLESDEAARVRKADLLRYQVNEIESARLTDGERRNFPHAAGLFGTQNSSPSFFLIAMRFWPAMRNTPALFRSSAKLPLIWKR